MKGQLEDEFGELTDKIMEQDIFDNGFQFVFALLSKTHLTLYEDMHMTTHVAQFVYSQLTFVDMGLAIMNEQKEQKFYFIKMVHEQAMKREVHLIAISEEHLQKWEYSLNLQKEADHEDNFYAAIRANLLKRIQQQQLLRNAAQSDLIKQGSLEVIDEQTPGKVRHQNTFGSGVEQSVKSFGDAKEERKRKAEERRLINQMEAEAYEYLMIGTTFIKYGQRGGPKSRHVFVHGMFLCWRDPRDDGVPNTKKEGVRNIPVKDIIGFENGRSAKNFEKYKKIGKDNVSFTIMGKQRNLDLEADSEADKQLFLNKLQILMSKCKREQPSNGVVPEGQQSAAQENKEQGAAETVR